MEVPGFKEAVERGELVGKGGYHNPDTVSNPRWDKCGCEKTTRNGAYRDVTVEMDDGMVLHFYHQSPIVVEKGDTVRLSSCGWETSTTKERINRYVPSGYRVYQEDHDWYISRRDGDTMDFYDGVEITEVRIMIQK